MEIEEIHKSVKSYFSDRKSPLFASMAVIWLFSYRKLLFGLFHFDDNWTLDQKLDWSHNQLQSFSIWKFHGFGGSVLYSILMGFIAMALFKLINTSGKLVNGLLNRLFDGILQWGNKSDWVPAKDYEEQGKELTVLEANYNRVRRELTEVQDLKDKADSSLKQEIHNKSTLFDTIAQERKKVDEEKIKSDQKTADLNKLIEQQRKMKIAYAKYGTDEHSIDVTKSVSNYISNNKAFTVNEASLGVSDIAPGKYKKLDVYWFSLDEGGRATIFEGEIVESTGRSVVSRKTPESNQHAIDYKKHLDAISAIRGAWELKYTKDGKVDSEIVLIDENGKYYCNGELTFEIRNAHTKRIDYFSLQIEFTKWDLALNEAHTTETVTHTNNYMKGTDTDNDKLEYTRIFSK